MRHHGVGEIRAGTRDGSRGCPASRITCTDSRDFAGVPVRQRLVGGFSRKFFAQAGLTSGSPRDRFAAGLSEGVSDDRRDLSLVKINEGNHCGAGTS